jgi:hypothetical protein
MPPTPGIPRWSKSREGSHCQQKFDEYVQSGGQQGWDPKLSGDANSVLNFIREDNILKPFLAVTLGGHKSNRNSDKGIGGYHRAASEFWTKLAKQGVRYKEFRAFPVLVFLIV